MPTYSLSPMPCNDIRLRSGKIVELVIIEDVPPSIHEEGMNPQHLSNTTPIIEDAEHPTNGTAKTQNDKSSDTQPTQLIRKPSYPKRLMLPRAGRQPQFNLLGELKNLYVKFPSFKLFKMYLYMLELFRICAQGNREGNLEILPLFTS